MSFDIDQCGHSGGMIRAVVVALLAALFVVQPQPALADVKADTIVLVNGDRITCEVSKLSRGQVTVKTDDSGTLVVKWDKIVSITTVGLFDVATTDGSRLVGQLDAAPGGQVVIIDPVSGDTHTFMLADVVSLAPIRAGFFHRIDGSLSVGASYTQSSGVAQTSFNGDATYRRPGFSVFTRASTTVTSDPDSGTSTRASAQAGYVRYRENRWVFSPFAMFESNRDLGFETRYTGAMTAGRYLVQTNRGLVLLSGGGALGREQPIDKEAVVNVDAIAVFNAAFFTYDFPKTSIDFLVQAFPSLNNPGRIRLNNDLTFRREVFRDVSLSISAYDNYDNRPESVNASKNDIGYSLSLGWIF